MAHTIQLRGGSSTLAINTNPVLHDREMGVETDTWQFKIGDGVTAWNDLPYGGLVGPAGQDGSRTSETVSTTPVTVTVASPNHAIFADTDTTGSIIDLTINDPTTQGSSLTVVAEGTYAVDLTLTGLTNEQIPVGEARSYIWTGTAWVLASGGGSGSSGGGNIGIGQAVWDAAGGSIPYDKLLADGALYNIVDYPALFARYGTTHGGDGITTFGVPDLQGKVPGAEGTSIVNGRTKGDATPIGGVREDQMQGHRHAVGRIAADGAYDDTLGTAELSLNGSSGGSQYGIVESTDRGSSSWLMVAHDEYGNGVDGDPRTGTQNRSTELVGRWLVQAFDAVQEIPADPGIVKDWVEKYVDDGTLANVTVPNSWGIGRYMVHFNGTSTIGGVSCVFDIEELGVVHTMRTTSGTDSFSGQYTSANEFKALVIGTGVWTAGYVSRISRWENVYGEDAQLSPAKDGWELVYDDIDNILDVPNSWGMGRYEVHLSESLASWSYPCALPINVANELSTWRSPLYARSVVGSSYIQASADGTDFSVKTIDAPLVQYIKRIYKFTGLVHVLHTYPATSADAFPENPRFGDECYRTDTLNWYKWNGATWTQI